MTNAFMKKGLVGIVAIALIAPAFLFPRPAEAQMAVIDHAAVATLNTILGVDTKQLSKDEILDAVAWQLANTVLESLSRSVVNWINSGFEGSPAFVQDLGENLSGVADAVAAEFIGKLADQVKDTPLSGTAEAVAYAYYLSTNGDEFLRRQLYTLRNTVQNDRAFTGGDFSQGGWRGWFALTGNRANNPHGAFLSAQRELERRIESSLEQRVTELNWGNGFLSWRGECADRQTTAGADGSLNAPVPSVNLGGEEHCLDAPIETPGSVIESQLNQTLAGGQQRLQVADEINEIVGALVTQLVNEALQGLSSVGSRSSGGSGFIDRTSAPVAPGQGSGTVDDLLVNGIEGQLTALATYQTNWQKILTTASAVLVCSEATEAEKAQAAGAKAEADTALGRVSIALASFNAIVAELRQIRPGVNQSASLPSIAQDFQALMTNPATPSTAEVTASVALAAETGTSTSLYMELKAAADRCVPVS